MRILAQRVKNARVMTGDRLHAEIKAGFLLMVGIASEDGLFDVEWMAQKISGLRVFEDSQGKLNLNISQVGGAILSVPNFTLCADLGKGHRPGFETAAPPNRAEDLWKKFNTALKEKGIPIQEGVFGSYMEVSLINSGPVTLWLDSKGARRP